ncbi:hypothetical protein C8R46DRAFT_179655 [Mycena filopes]|nr:hypothetical protein C8R46DRAFT_179655 [Mycena filopes]
MCLLYQFHPYQTIFASTRGIESSSSPSSSFSSSNTTGARHKRKPQIILLGTSRIYYAATRERFHAALQFIIGAPQVDLVPVVVIASDAGTRGEARDEHLASGVWGWGLHVRTVLGWARIAGRAVCRGDIRPIALTLMNTALLALASIHFASAPKDTGSLQRRRCSASS